MKRMLALLDGVDALAKVWNGKNAEGEPWLQTASRIEELGKLAKSARREMDKQSKR